MRIRKNSLYSTLSITSRLIANVVVFWVLARYYGPAIFGKFTFAHTLTLIFILFADFGIDVLLTNEIARNRNNAIQIFRQYFSLKLIFTLLALSGMLLFVLFNNLDLQSRSLLLIFSLYVVFNTLSNFLFAFFKGYEKLEYEMKVSLFVNICLFIFTLILIVIKANILYVAGVFVITRFLGFALGLKYSFIVEKNISYKLVFGGFGEIKDKVLVFGLHLFFNYLFFQLDTILLALWKGDYDVGIYQSAFKLILIPLVIPDILTNTLTPVLARFNIENQIQWKRLGNIMNKVLFIIGLPISIILFVSSEQIINIIYGSKNYWQAIPVLRVFAIILFIRFNLEAFALNLTTSNRQNIRMYVVIIATLLNFVLNYFIIPVYGAFGAVTVSLITNCFVGFIYFVVTIPSFNKSVMNFKTWFVFIMSMGLSLLLWLFKSVTIFLIAPTVIIIFILIGYFYFFTKEEKKLILPKGSEFLAIKSRFF
ncbi:MAG: flippase [Ignavibacteriales bacterium]|nr:flippase [Ignavibacteriales bacterium]